MTDKAEPTTDVVVQDNPEARRFEARLGDHLAVAEYDLEPDCITFTHTRVPDALAGRGIGSKLAKACLQSARDRGLQVKPKCSFIAGYIQKHPEYQALLHPTCR